MELKTTQKIIENLKMAAQMLDWPHGNPPFSDWFCAVDLVQNTLPDMVMHKREVYAKAEGEKSNVEG